MAADEIVESENQKGQKLRLFMGTLVCDFAASVRRKKPNASDTM